MAVDALYDEEDGREREAFEKAVESLWERIVDVSAVRVLSSYDGINSVHLVLIFTIRHFEGEHPSGVCRRLMAVNRILPCDVGNLLADLKKQAVRGDTAKGFQPEAACMGCSMHGVQHAWGAACMGCVQGLKGERLRTGEVGHPKQRTAMENVDVVLARHWEALETIDLNAVLTDLRGNGIFSHGQFSDIMDPGRSTREKRLFLQTQLPLEGDHAFPTFIRILRQRNHISLADTLERDRTNQTRREIPAAAGLSSPLGRTEAVTPSTHRDAITRNWSLLLDNMDAVAVENHLIDNRMLPLSKREELSSVTHGRRRREMLLEYVAARDARVFECFLEALDAAHQTDISDRLRGNRDI
ncbi:unnamed protein product [Darwinula stevensoni]|uniref:CARD domain-containing protein n=1 Tax=Darwinula stevensoni TaxID=69355 RepID=A0A7R8WYY7_9CRUS|nr:unnamed protein product [Darwinula stevensoni]CAG0879955.1 unnamed protein product [Darwinula stevensoni]